MHSQQITGIDKSPGWNWVNKMGTAWINKDPQAIPLLFAAGFKYYENPFESPLTDKNALLNLWQEVPDSQKDVTFNFEILSESGYRCLAHWQTSFIRIPTGKKSSLDGIFLINLDSAGLCTLFKQWWVSKESK